MSERWIPLPELAGVVGQAEAVALCRAWGGLSKYLPRTPGPEHPFAPIIGMAAMRALAAYAGGYHVALPNLRRPDAEKSRILDLLAAGWTHTAIAEECKVSERWVRYLASRRRDSELKLPL